MKKIIAVMLALILVLALAAGCGNTNKSDKGGAGGTGGPAVEANTKGLELAIDLNAVDLGKMKVDDLDARGAEGSFRADSDLDLKEMMSAKDAG